MIAILECNLAPARQEKPVNGNDAYTVPAFADAISVTLL
ncbi:hypothetical protein V1292_000354 [Bradyrhizobium sp. AZCC 1719]